MDHQYAPEGSSLEHKLQLYSAAVMLFEQGRSHPQIIEFLLEYEKDRQQLELIVDKAMRDEWDQLYEYSRQLLAEGKSYDEVIRLMSEKENDQDIVHFLCNKWYEWKTEWLEHTYEAPYNIQQGLLWIILSGSMVAIVFAFQWSWFAKIMWPLALLASILQFAYGIIQKRLSRNIEKILHTKLNK